MDKKRKKIKCKCGKGYFETFTEYYRGHPYEIEKCSNCDYKVFSVEQMEEYQNIMKMIKAEKDSRKIIKIGNSLGITLPRKLNEFGVKVGDKAKIKFVNKHSLQIDFAD